MWPSVFSDREFPELFQVRDGPLRGPLARTRAGRDRPNSWPRASSIVVAQSPITTATSLLIPLDREFLRIMPITSPLIASASPQLPVITRCDRTR